MIASRRCPAGPGEVAHEASGVLIPLELVLIGQGQHASRLRSEARQGARRFSLSSLPLDAELFARAVREHWHIGNRLHWVLDVVFHEDLSRLRSGHGPQNMASVRRVALNLLRGAKDKHSPKVRRTSAAWDDTYLETIVRQTV